MAENSKYLDLKEILDIEKIKAVNRPIEEANGLPNECYTNTQYLMIEREGF